jgi:hypothetical protein
VLPEPLALNLLVYFSANPTRNEKAGEGAKHEKSDYAADDFHFLAPLFLSGLTQRGDDLLFLALWAVVPDRNVAAAKRSLQAADGSLKGYGVGDSHHTKGAHHADATAFVSRPMLAPSMLLDVSGGVQERP